MIVVVLGPPGAGKGTQSDLLARELEIPHLATGDLLREAIANRTKLGQLAQPYMDRGELVPDDVVVSLIKEQLLLAEPPDGAILDGFPRTLAQGRALNQMLAELGRQVGWVIYLRVPSEELLQRITGRYVCSQCGATYHLGSSPSRIPGVCDVCGGALQQRPDDRLEVARRRLDVYFARTAPLIDFYRCQGVLTEINGEQSIESVLHDELAARPARDRHK